MEREKSGERLGPRAKRDVAGFATWLLTIARNVAPSWLSD
jgi:DNA-directed RNA polymerase specialized sigma24 family protein